MSKSPAVNSSNDSKSPKLVSTALTSDATDASTLGTTDAEAEGPGVAEGDVGCVQPNKTNEATNSKPNNANLKTETPQQLRFDSTGTHAFYAFG